MSNFFQKSAPWSYIVLGVLGYCLLMFLLLSGKSCGESGVRRKPAVDTNTAGIGNSKGGDREIIEVPKDTPQEMTIIRPLNGQSLTKKDPEKGPNEINIQNNGDSDAIIKLVDVETGRTYRHSYVHSGRVLELKSIKSGSYWIKFSTGSDYALEKGVFTVEPSYMMFETPTTFISDVTGNRESYTTLSIVLFPSKGGNMRARLISEDEFADREDTETVPPPDFGNSLDNQISRRF